MAIHSGPEPFSSVPWQAFPKDEESKTKAWHKHNVPYKEDSNALQNLDIWLETSRTCTEPIHDHTLPTPAGTWIIFIHGGAWRDPLITSTSFAATVENIVNNQREKMKNSVAGYASINYSLSPHPQHPTDPLDSSRQAKHPDHILDVLSGIRYLQRHIGFESNYILVGHSCGATLAFQVAMNHQRWGEAAVALGVKKPKTIVGLNGLYNLPELIKNPGPKHEHLIPAYDAFTRLAFEDESSWHEISPVNVQDWNKEWPERALVVLVQSKDDTLVPYSQLDMMRKALQQNTYASGSKDVLEMDATGDHDELWISGRRVAEIIVDVVAKHST